MTYSRDCCTRLWRVFDVTIQLADGLACGAAFLLFLWGIGG